MRKWTRILPLFIIVWWAKKDCEKFWIQGEQWHLAFEDVLVRAKRKAK